MTNGEKILEVSFDDLDHSDKALSTKQAALLIDMLQGRLNRQRFKVSRKDEEVVETVKISETYQAVVHSYPVQEKIVRCTVAIDTCAAYIKMAIDLVNKMEEL